MLFLIKKFKVYLDRYKDTKIMVVSSSGDEFFIPDNTYSYWRNLRAITSGTAMLKRVPNADHSFKNHQIALYSAIQTFFLSIFSVCLLLSLMIIFVLLVAYLYEFLFYFKKTPKPLPSLTWSIDNNATHGIIKCLVDTTKGPTPSLVKGYQAQTLSSTK